LLVFGIHFTLDAFKVIKYSIAFFAMGIMLYNLFVADFILPELSEKKSFYYCNRKIYQYFLSNKLNVCFFYSFKLCLVGISLILYLYALIFISKPLIYLPTAVDFSSNLYITWLTILGAFVSICLYALFIQFFNVFCLQLKHTLFPDILGEKGDAHHDTFRL
jgi:hypothetical protein